MRRHGSLLVNLLVVLSFTLSSVLVVAPFAAQTGRARVAQPETSPEGAGEPVLASKRAKIKHERRQDRRQDAERERKQDHAKTHHKRNPGRANHKPNTTQGQVTIGEWENDCQSLKSIRQQKIDLCTHGPDPAPAGLSITKPVPLLSEEAAA